MHYPVMLRNVLKSINNLKISRKIHLLDCNFGLGGHSNAIVKQFANIHIRAYDLDASIIQKYKNSHDLQKGDQTRIQIINGNFTQALKQEKKFDILLADLGFNSVQLEDNDGFSWLKDSPLDMRYSKEFQLCSSMIDRLSFVDLMDILIKYGDLNITQAKLAAKVIGESKPIKSTFQLRDCVVGCFQGNKTRKVAQVFQAMRIATNRQLQSLKQLCQNMDKILNKNALVLFLTFHSLQRDVIYKQIKQKQKNYSKIKTQVPSFEEIQENSRSKSAQLLYFKKL